MILEWVAAAIAGYCATILAERLAHATGFVARPNPIVPQHTRPVAYLGGLGVLGGLLAGLVVAGPPYPSDHVLAGIVLYALLGAADDARPFRPAAKFALQAAVAAVTVAMGLQATVTYVPLIDHAIAVFVVLVLVNAVNFTDVCDGLVASLGVVTLLAAVLVFHPPDTSLYVVGSGACAGFFLRNRPPARIFLGDAGSHLVGFLLAAAWLDATTLWGRRHEAIGGALVCGVFLFELAFITAVRIYKGLPWWRGSPDHFSLRLQAAGWTRGQVDAVAAGSAVVLAALGWAMPRVGAVPVVLIVLVWAGLASAYLLRHEVTNARPREEDEVPRIGAPPAA